MARCPSCKRTFQCLEDEDPSSFDCPRCGYSDRECPRCGTHCHDEDECNAEVLAQCADQDD